MNIKFLTALHCQVYFLFVTTAIHQGSSRNKDFDNLDIYYLSQLVYLTYFCFKSGVDTTIYTY